MSDLPFHPLANVLPLIEGAEFNQLVDSITENGLHDPITLFEGAILDGRNRYRACLKAGVKPRTEVFNGGDPIAFVMDRNLHRRHLTSGQKAMAVVKFATLSHGVKPDVPKGTSAPSTIAQVAQLAGVGRGSMADAKIILAHGTPQEFVAVSNGTRAVRSTATEVRNRRRGDKPRQKSGRRTAQKRQLAIFERAISLLCNSCETTAELEIPKLDAKQRKAFDEQLLEAQRAMRELRRRVNDEGDRAHG